MGTYNIKLAINFTGETGYVICVPRKTTAPLTNVVCTIDGVPAQTRKVYPAPHTQAQMIVEGLDPVIYFFKFYRSTDGVTLDEQINIIAIDAKTGASQVLTRYTYVVDRGDSGAVSGSVWSDPIAGDSGIGDERLAGRQYYIEERGTGSLMENEIVNRLAGGFDFADPAKVFEAGVYFAWVVNDVTLPDSTGTRATDTPTIVLLPTNTTYDPVIHSGMILQAAAASAVLVLTLPALGTLADGFFMLDSNGGVQRNFLLQLSGGDTANFLGLARNKIILGRGESVRAVIAAGVLYLYDYSGDARKRGQIVWGFYNTPNTYYLAGTGPHQLTDWPAVAEIINNLNPLSIITSFVTWGNNITDTILKYPNKGKWCVPGDGTFYFPDMRKQYIRAIDFNITSPGADPITIPTDTHRISQGPGGFQKQALEEHYHLAGTETPPGPPYRSGAPHAVRAWSATAGAPSGNPASTAVNIDAQPGDNRTDNQGSLPLMCI